MLLESIWDKYIEEYAAICSKYYTIDDLRELCAFYKTPLGEKLIKCSPEIKREAMTLMQSYQPEIAAIFSKYIKD